MIDQEWDKEVLSPVFLTPQIGGLFYFQFKTVSKEQWPESKIRSTVMQTGNSAIVAFFVTSPCMKELKSQNCILSNPEQARGKPLNDGKKKRP